MSSLGTGKILTNKQITWSQT